MDDRSLIKRKWMWAVTAKNLFLFFFSFLFTVPHIIKDYIRVYGGQWMGERKEWNSKFNRYLLYYYRIIYMVLQLIHLYLIPG